MQQALFDYYQAVTINRPFDVPVSCLPDYDGDEWYTPGKIVQAARRVLGTIDLDPASCYEAQKVVQAANYYTKEDDALRPDLEWHGKLWLNPPYSMPLIKQFVTKLIRQYDAGNVEAAIIITNNSSDTGWFHQLLARFPACFTYGRVPFWRPNHKDFGTRQGQTIFYLGDDYQRFCSVFSRIGQIVIATRQGAGLPLLEGLGGEEVRGG